MLVLWDKIFIDSSLSILSDLIYDIVSKKNIFWGMVIRKERKYWLKIHGADFAVPPKKKKNDRNVMVHYFGRICFGGMLRIMNSVLSTSHFLEWKRQESRKNNRKRAGKGKDAFNILRCFNWKADRS